MADNKISDIIKTSLDGIKEFADINTIVGKAITTETGVTVIPVSKISIGFANGGVDFGTNKAISNNFGCGGGTGVSITPLAFLVVGREADVELITLNDNNGSVGKLISVIEHAPEIIEKIRGSMS